MNENHLKKRIWKNGENEEDNKDKVNIIGKEHHQNSAGDVRENEVNDNIYCSKRS